MNQNYDKQYPEHAALFYKIVESVNTTSRLINEFNELCPAGDEYIDLMGRLLMSAQREVINILDED